MAKGIHFVVVTFLISIISIPASLAQTAPEDLVTIRSGTTPDNFLYTFDVLYDDLRLAITSNPAEHARLAAEISAERLFEVEAMIDAGKYAAAAQAMQENRDSLIATTESVGSLFSAAPEVLIEIEKLTVFNKAFADNLQDELAQRVEAGDVAAEDAAAIDFELARDLAVGAQAEFEDAKDGVIAGIAEGRGISVIEAELQYEAVEQSAGLIDQKLAEVGEDLIEARETIDQMKESLAALPEGSEEATVLSNAIEDAKLRLQIAETAFENKDYSDSFEKLSEAQDAAFTADRYFDYGIRPDEYERYGISPQEEFASMRERWGDFEAIREEIDQESERFVQEYEQFRDAIVEKFPEKADVLESSFEQAERAQQLALAVGEQYQAEFEDLVAGGTSNEEAAKILATKFADEYRKAYGEEFVPPGFIVTGEQEFDPTAEDAESFADAKIEAAAGGGFVIGTQYIDPVTDYKYEFTDTGWRFTTPTGQAYESTYPEGYEPPEAYVEGNEVYTYTVDTPSGETQYTYTATGYEVVTPEGESESFAYTPGEYKLPDGRVIEQTPTGYEIKSGDEVAVRYDFNPEFGTYATSDGTVFRPPEGAYHHANIDYSAASRNYNYNYGSDTWTFNPTTGSWSSSSGETYKPQAAVVAPVGYESRESFTTPSGESWTFDRASGTWTSLGGESYTLGTGEFTSSTGATTNYNYQNRQQQYNFDSNTGEYRYETVTSTGTGGWTYDPSAGTWTSSTGETVSGGYVPPSDYPTPSYLTPPTYQTPGPYVTPSFSYPTPFYSYPSPSYTYPTPGTYLTPYPYPTPYSYPTPGNVYQSPFYSYPTPGEHYPSPTYYTYPTPGDAYPTPYYSYPSPFYSYPTPSGTYPTPSYSYPTPTVYPTPYPYPTPGEVYTTPSYSYPTPSTYTYPTPGEAYAYPSPYQYPTPGTSYTTPVSYSYPSPGTTYSYPSPSSYTYPTPGTTYSYPSPYSYPTPGTTYPYPTPYSYPTPGSYVYPTPSYPTPSSSYSYPTPGESYSYPSPSYSYPSPSSYPTPSSSGGSYSYPSPYAYPTPGESYPTPSSYPYPTPSSYSYPSPSYPTPSSYSYPSPSYSSPYGTPDSYSSPYSYPSPYGTPA